MDDRIAALASGRYISLTTYRKDGRAVATPVWFAVDAARILVWTDAVSGKAKRVRANGRASVAPCDMRGRTKQAPVDMHARVLPAGDFAAADRLLSARYRLLKPLIGFSTALGAIARRKPPPAEVYIELRLLDIQDGVP